jgi:hypothetical protein
VEILPREYNTPVTESVSILKLNVEEAHTQFGSEFF